MTHIEYETCEKFNILSDNVKNIDFQISLIVTSKNNNNN